MSADLPTPIDYSSMARDQLKQAYDIIKEQKGARSYVGADFHKAAALTYALLDLAEAFREDIKVSILERKQEQ